MKTTLIGRMPVFIASGCFIAALVVAALHAGEPEVHPLFGRLVPGLRSNVVQAPVYVRSARKSMALVSNSSCIVVMQQKMPCVQVINPDIIDVLPLSPTQLQVYAKKAGVTEVLLWDEEKKITTIKVFVRSDVEELSYKLRQLFPDAKLQLIALPGAMIVGGYVSQPGEKDMIVAICQQYHPHVVDYLYTKSAN
jgi:pilus assembly protein CpaC